MKSKEKEIINLLFKKTFKPRKKYNVNSWAEKYRILSREGSPKPGRWVTKNTPYLLRIMKMVTEKEVKKITIMSSAQVGKTEVILNIIGFFIEQDPCPMLLVFPSSKFGESFSHERLSPMIRDTKVLKKIMDNRNNNTVMRKKFPGGYIAIVGTENPAHLSGRPVRVILMDEVDRFKRNSGKEGSPIELADRRTQNFDNSKSIRVSTPTIDGESLIQDEFNLSSQEEWAIPCPSCGELQVLRWENIKWENDNPGIVKMVCDNCGVISDEKIWRANEDKGEWIAKFPERKQHLGFTLNALSSPWVSWSDIVYEYIDAGTNPLKLQTFYNTVLGRVWSYELGDVKDYAELYEEKINYEAELHENIVYLTASVDVQDNRLEVLVMGWGYGQTSYAVKYLVIPGNTTDPKTWGKLDDFLSQKFYYKDKEKNTMIACTFIDSGHNTKTVYEYVSDKEHRNIFAIKGVGGEGRNPLTYNEIKKEGSYNIKLWSLGVNALKELTYARLKLKEGDGCCYFPTDSTAGFDLPFFEGLISERKVRKLTVRGFKWEWQVIGQRRNEPLDLFGYATAAMLSIENTEKILVKEGEE